MEFAAPKDLDPEDADGYQSDSEIADTDSDVGTNKAREHYEAVSNGSLRRPESINLGPKYTGTRVRRDAADKEDEDDPFDQEFGDSEREDEADSGRVRMQNVILNDVDRSSDAGDVSEDGSDTDMSDVGDDEEDAAHQAQSVNDVDRSELRKLMAEDQRSVAVALSHSVRADVEKGKAVKQQRATFDTLLNARIRLQKALIATNSVLAPRAQKEQKDQATDGVVEAAQVAAITLWNNLNAMRSAITRQPGEKRLHVEMTVHDSMTSFWKQTQAYELMRKKPRNSALDFWASKTRATTALPQTRGRLQAPVKEQQLSDVLQGQTADMSRLIAKTQVPRSCAPIQADLATSLAAHIDDIRGGKDIGIPIYDDADFYTALLSNLIAQRSADAAVSFGDLSIKPWQAAREAKTRKSVDAKASKGRKLRYTLHEKLVSFMASEDRGAWSERQADELFGSLFGRRAGLSEEAGIDVDEQSDGLRLFNG